jgi:ribosomal protein L44E
MGKRGKTSKVYDYFTTKDEISFYCKDKSCVKHTDPFVTSSKIGTKNLIDHIRIKHKRWADEYEAATEAKNEEKEKKIEEEGTARAKAVRKVQTSITDTFKSSKPWSDDSADSRRMDRLIVEKLALDDNPLSEVEKGLSWYTSFYSK